MTTSPGCPLPPADRLSLRPPLAFLAVKLQESEPTPPADPTEAELHLQEQVGQLQREQEELRGQCQAQVRDNEQLSRLNQEQEERLLELEKALQRHSEEAVDRQQILENMQSDKATISRALTQNRELKEQLAELQNGFVKLVRLPWREGRGRFEPLKEPPPQ